MNRPLLTLVIRWLVLALGVTLAEKLVPGIECKDGATLLVVVVLLSFFNAVLRPLLLLFTLPFIVLTLGVGVVAINALMFLLVGRLVEGFHVAGFWPAVWAAIIVGATNFALLGFTRRPPGNGPGGRGPKFQASADFEARIGRGNESRRAAPTDTGRSNPPDVIDV